MKKLHLLRFMGFVLAVGMVLAACDNGNTSAGADVLDGTAWEITIANEQLLGSLGDNTEFTITAGVIFNSPNFVWWYTFTPGIPELYTNYVPKLIKGTYTVSGNDVTISVDTSLPEIAGLPGRTSSGVIEGNRIAFQDHDETVYYDKQY
jgi:predicted small secreted protein